MGEVHYRIGLDIGTNSVGWGIVGLDLKEDGVYETNSIIRLGVRMFDKAEIPKTGASLAEPRRLARSSRRRLRRKANRKKAIRQLLMDYDVVNETELNQLYPLEKGSIDVWDIRLDGLDRLLSRLEWARLLIHLAQRRGFKSNRKSEEKELESGKVLSSIQENRKRLKDYRTVGEMWINDPEFSKYNQRRNSPGEYVFNVSRYDLEQEIITLFETQRKLHSAYATKELQNTYLKIWNHQLPFASGNAILKKVGNCTLEPEEKRIPKATFTFQYFMALDKINRIRVGPNVEPLSLEQRESILKQLFHHNDLIKRKKPPVIKYSDIRKWIKLDEDLKFNELTYTPESTLAQNEKSVFVNLNAYYEIKQMTDLHAAETGQTYSAIEWDAIGFALTVYKTDKDIRNYLKNPQNIAHRIFDEDLIGKLLSLSYTKFGHLSFKAIQRLTPIMEKGLTFKEAADNLEYDTTGLRKTVRSELLPQIPDEIANPVVKRALTQSRKVVNAIIKRYGPPVSIHIEMARELSKSHDERSKIIREQKANNERNTGAINILAENDIPPKGYNIVRYKLWKEQGGKCAYSLKPIPPERFFAELRNEKNRAPSLDVDHILPYSKSFMDSYQNKVLVYSDENRKKGNRLPFEYLKDYPERWGEFEKFVHNNMSFSKKKKQYLLKKEFSPREEEMVKERHLNDTRFISRYFKNFVEQHLQPKDPNLKKWVETVSGQVTAHLRSRWGLEKHRNETHLHHALDAVVIACTDHRTIQRVTNYHKDKETSKHKKYFFPQPWEGFRDELLDHLNKSPIPEEIHRTLENKLSLPSYVMVSRMPKRSVTGAAHLETIMKNGGVDEKNGKTLIVKRVPLKEIKFNKDGDFQMYNKNMDLATYEAIKNRYLKYGGNVNEAFQEPLYKPCKNGKGNQIHRVKVITERRSFVREVNKGVAQNGDLIRVDLFLKEGTYHMVPIYAMDVGLQKLPNKIVASGKGYAKWEELDDTFDFQFSLYPYDLVRLKHKDNDLFLYFSTIDIDSNRMIFREPNKPHGQTAHRYSIRQIGCLEKYQIGVLGELSRVKNETRQPFRRKKLKHTV